MRSSNSITDEELLKGLKSILETFSQWENFDCKLIHGDIHEGQIIRTEETKEWLILDFGISTISHIDEIGDITEYIVENFSDNPNTDAHRLVLLFIVLEDDDKLKILYDIYYHFCDSETNELKSLKLKFSFLQGNSIQFIL